MRSAFVAGCAALALVGCSTLSGVQQHCDSNFGLLDKKQVNCTGSVETISGSPSLNVIDIGEQVNGAFRLEVDMEVGQGTARAHVIDIDDKQVGGEVSPGEPLQISAVVYPEEADQADDEDDEVDVQLEVAKGKEVRNLNYEATLLQQQ